MPLKFHKRVDVYRAAAYISQPFSRTCHTSPNRHKSILRYPWFAYVDQNIADFSTIDDIRCKASTSRLDNWWTIDNTCMHPHNDDGPNYCNYCKPSCTMTILRTSKEPRHYRNHIVMIVVHV